MIAFDASASKDDSSGSNSTMTNSHTCTGSNLILFVAAEWQSASNLLTGVTYNGVSMTEIGRKINTSSIGWTSLFYLIAPATGANNVVITLSSAANIFGYSASYTGAKQSGQPDSSATVNSSTSPLTMSTTVVANNCWLVASTFSENGGFNWTTGTGRGASRTYIGDSNGTVGTGSQSLVFANSGGDLSGVIASFAPAPLKGGFFMFM